MITVTLEKRKWDQLFFRLFDQNGTKAGPSFSAEKPLSSKIVIKRSLHVKKKTASFGVKMMFYLRTVLRCSVSFLVVALLLTGCWCVRFHLVNSHRRSGKWKNLFGLDWIAVTAKNKCTAYDEIWNLILDTHYNVIFKSNLIRWLWCIRMILKNPF